jgi:hypothetical protein
MQRKLAYSDAGQVAAATFAISAACSSGSSITVTRNLPDPS